MTCPDCGGPLPDNCARENEMFAAYARGIEVPPMWEGIEARLSASGAPHPGASRRSLSPLAGRGWGWIAAAALLAIVVAGVLVVRGRATSPAALAAEHYRQAIRRLESHAPRGAAALLPPLTAAIDEAEREARQRPDDPIAVTRLVAAYDAKLQLLRTYD